MSGKVGQPIELDAMECNAIDGWARAAPSPGPRLSLESPQRAGALDRDRDIFVARIFAFTHDRTDLNEARRLLQALQRLRSKFRGRYDRLELQGDAGVRLATLLDARSRHLELLELLSRSGILQFLVETAGVLLDRPLEVLPLDLLSDRQDRTLWDCMHAQAARRAPGLPYDGGRAHLEGVSPRDLCDLLKNGDPRQASSSERAIAAAGKVAAGGFFAVAHLVQGSLAAILAALSGCAPDAVTRALQCASGTYVGLTAASDGWRDLATLAHPGAR